MITREQGKFSIVSCRLPQLTYASYPNPKVVFESRNCQKGNAQLLNFRPQLKRFLIKMGGGGGGGGRPLPSLM